MAPTLNDVAHTAPPYGYRCPRCDGDQCDASCAEELERIIGSHTSGDLAAVVVEPVMGEAGIIVPPAGWLERVRRSPTTTARYSSPTRSRPATVEPELFASSHFDVEPDILTQAKGIANDCPSVRSLPPKKSQTPSSPATTSRRSAAPRRLRRRAGDDRRTGRHRRQRSRAGDSGSSPSSRPSRTSTTSSGRREARTDARYRARRTGNDRATERRLATG